MTRRRRMSSATSSIPAHRTVGPSPFVAIDRSIAERHPRDHGVARPRGYPRRSCGKDPEAPGLRRGAGRLRRGRRCRPHAQRWPASPGPATARRRPCSCPPSTSGPSSTTANGALQATLYGEQNRAPVPLAQIPAQVREAIIVVEDENFYSHEGVNLRATIRALFENVSSGAHRAGRVDDHDAGRQERHPRQPPHPRPQDRGGDPRPAPRGRAHQGPDPRALPQHRLLRQRRLRRPGGGRDLLGRRRRASSTGARPPSWPRSSATRTTTTRSASPRSPPSAAASPSTASSTRAITAEEADDLRLRAAADRGAADHAAARRLLPRGRQAAAARRSSLRHRRHARGALQRRVLRRAPGPHDVGPGDAGAAERARDDILPGDVPGIFTWRLRRRRPHRAAPSS